MGGGIIMYSTPALQVARRFVARDITESRLLQYDVICAVQGSSQAQCE